MKLKDFIVTDSIIADLKATDRDGAIRELVTSLANAGALPEDAVDEVVAALVKREQNGSTGFGKGVAVPHVKHPKIKQMAGTIGRSGGGDRLRGAGSSAGLQHRSAAEPGQPAAAASPGDEHRLHQSAEGYVPPFPSSKRNPRSDRRFAG